MTKKTLDEHAEEVRDAVCTADVRGWPAGRCPLPEVVAAYEAEREARLALEARVRELLDAHAKLLDRLETAKARVRELEAERSAWASSAGKWAGEAAAQEDARHVAEAGLDEHAEAVDEAADVFRRPEDWSPDELAMHHRATVSAYEAERAARVALEARVLDDPTKLEAVE